jgi:prepilin-type processing-associated H-X9-DG protein/prepilin-type N-terminal cleavage/methylation domain-containing protein
METLNKRTNGRDAFTLVELLVVISIIALLLAILMPALSKARALARAAVCLSNIKQCSTVCYLYMEDNRGEIPITSLNLYWPATVASEVQKIKGFSTAKFEYCADRPITNQYAAIFGMNELLANLPPTPPLKIAQAKRAAMRIFMSDTICQQERYMLQPDSTNARDDWSYKLRSQDLDLIINGSPPWFRHSNKANMLFLDGHAERRGTKEVSQSCVDPTWYYYHP